MPTKTIKPQWGVVRSGYTPSKPLFDSDQVEKLAGILGRPMTELDAPLARAGLAIGPYYLSQLEASEPEQELALSELANAAETLLSRLDDLDSRSRHKLLKEYTGIEGDLTLAAAFKKSRVGWGEYRKDIVSLTRLRDNIVVSFKRMKLEREKRKKEKTAEPPRGRPKKWFEHSAARELIDAYKSIAGSDFPKGKGPHRSFVLAALFMLGLEQSAASGAITRALKVPSSKKIPSSPGF